MTKSRSRRARVRPEVERSWLATAGVTLIFAKAVLVPIVFDLAAAQPFALPKSAASRALLYPLILVLVAYLALYPQKRPRGALIWAIAAYGALATLATALAVHPSTALYGALGRYLGLTSILDGIVLALAVMTFADRPRAVPAVVCGVVLGASVVQTYALVQIAGADWIAWTEGQTASTMGNSGALAGLLVCAAAVAAITLVVRWAALPWSLRLVLSLLAITGPATSLLIGTRSAALALPVALAAVGVMWWRQRRSSVQGIVVLPARSGTVILATVILLALSLAAVGSTAGARLLALVQGGDSSSGERALIYRAAMSAFSTRPLLGAGPDSFVVVYPSVRPVEIAAFSGEAMQSSTHSWFLHQLVGTGLMGLVSLLIVVWLALRRSARDPVQLGPAAGAVGLVTFLAQGAFSISHVGTEWMFWAFVGLAGTGVSGDHEAADRRPPKTPAWKDILATVGALAIGMAAATTAPVSVDASHKMLLSERSRQRGDMAGAASWAERAVRLDAGRADYWNSLGLAYVNEPGRSVAAFRRAHEAAPYDPTYLLNLAAAEAALAGSKELALEHVRRSTQMDPYSAGTHERAARVLMQLDDPRGATTMVDKALALSPRPESYFLLAADIYEAAGRKPEAIHWLERHVARHPGDAPVEARRRLARLYYESGDRLKLDMILPPPRAVQARMCGPTCVLVRFDSAEDLRTDDSSGSALNVANYRLRGAPLPPGTRVELRAPLTSALIMPPGTQALAPSDLLEIRGVVDAYGRTIGPNPTVLGIEQ